jgi:chromate transporter
VTAVAGARPGFGALIRYFLRLGSTGFGGPIALVGAMQRDLVERRGWFSAEEFSRSLALSQLAPGPLAAQVAFCLGYLHSRLRGAAAVGIAFIAPSLIMTMALGAAYLRYGGMPWLAAAFYGVGAVVIGIIVVSAIRLARTTARGDPLLWSIVGLAAMLTWWQAREPLWLIVLAGFAVVIRSRAARARATVACSLIPVLFWYFTQAGLFIFGSGLAIVPFLYSGVVTDRGWLTEPQFLDAIAVAMMTPGPVVIVVGFIGYLVAGTLGAVAATLGVFLPAFLLTVLLLPAFTRLAGRPMVAEFVSGVTAAAAGAIAGACLVLGRSSIHDLPTLLLALGALLVVARTRLPSGLVVLAGAAAGILLRGGVGR